MSRRLGRLFRKYVLVLVTLVTGALLTSSLVGIYFSYQENKDALLRVQREKAVAAALMIEQFVKDIEHQIEWTAKPAWGASAAVLEQRRLDYLRLLRQVPAVTDISYVDPSGREQLRVSRLATDEVGSKADLSKDPTFLEAKGGRTYFSPVVFREESEPYITLAMAGSGRGGGVSVAEVNLRLIWDVVSQIRMGKGGYAYVVDSKGQLIAHPDISLVLQKTDLSSLAQVQAARGAILTSGEPRDAGSIARDPEGRLVLTAYAPIAPLGWLVFVDLPVGEAFVPLYGSIVRTVALLLLGLALSVLASVVLARKMVTPIRTLQAGAARIGAGDLGHRIEVRTGNELEALGEEFNRAAARLEESYTTLEQKVEARTRELADANTGLTESLAQQTATSEILRTISSSPTDVQPVLKAVGANAARLCNASDAQIFRIDGDMLRPVASYGELWPAVPVPLNRHSVPGRAVIDREIVRVQDLMAELDEFSEGSAFARRFGHRTVLAAPLLREGVAVGAILIRRLEVRPFSDKQIELLQTFADQAVIAIENVRLFQEIEARTRELTRSVKELQALGEVSQAVSSILDLPTVLTTIVSRAAELSGSHGGTIYEFDEATQTFHVRATHRIAPEHLEALRATPIRLGEGAVGTAGATRAPVQVADILDEREFVAPQTRHILARLGFRSLLALPLLREQRLLGGLIVYRKELGRFPSEVVNLLQTFATQSVLAIQNARLFQEIHDKGRELEGLSRNMEQLYRLSTAMQEPLSLAEQLTRVLEAARQVVGFDRMYVWSAIGDTMSTVADAGLSTEEKASLTGVAMPIGEAGVLGKVYREGVPLVFTKEQPIPPELRLRPPYSRIEALRSRSILAIPMIARGRTVGVLAADNKVSDRPILPHTVDVLQTFAAQAAVAVENARLFREIQRQKQYSESLVEHSPVAIATMDLSGTVVSWNPAAERLFGYTGVEAIGRNLDELVTTPEIRDEARTISRQTVRGERVHAMTRRARKDGTLLDVEVSSVPVIVDGTEVGYIAIYHDITELLRARQEAEAANQAKSAFLATMSHEIRTPMNAVIGMSGLLLNTDLGEEQREYASIIRQSGDALLTIINDILDFSKIEAGKMELEYQPFDLRDCVEASLDLVATRAGEKGLDLAYLIEAETPAAIVGDVARLRQILLNLLSNAIKFTEKGEVVVGVTGRHLEAPGGLWELAFRVRDTGIGIPPDRLERLFQSFSQVDASTARKYGGTGLGLAISKRLAELMGGQISVESQVGQGTQFRFTIRARAAEGAVAARRDLSGIEPQLRGKRVLVVDDNETNRRILTSQVSAWGMVARGTGSPREALDWIRAGEPFGVAILDMHMPEMDGVALGTAIRANREAAALPLILYTSLGRREAGAEGVAFAAYLTKPVKPSQLFDTLVGVLAAQPTAVPTRGVARGQLDSELGRRHPLRILLAEDNVVNQKLALRLLGQLGYQADVAANGLEAIKAVERQPYDLVLMDVQMPEMDGFEASREINRRWPEKERPRIVAMTANAMQGDRELCLAAGMDDYVSKPIRVEELVTAITRCQPTREAGMRGAATAVVAEPAAPELPARTVIDPAVLEQLRATMGAGFVAELIETFLEDGRELIGAMRRALLEHDIDGFRRAAHSLKSNAASLGATGLSERARELEVIARTGGLDGADERLARLAVEYEAVTQALERPGDGNPS